MKKLLFIALGTMLISACSTSQLSITQSRYGNGLGISFGNSGTSKAEQEKAEAFRKSVQDRIAQRRMLKALTSPQRAIQPGAAAENPSQDQQNVREDAVELPKTQATVTASAKKETVSTREVVETLQADTRKELKQVAKQARKEYKKARKQDNKNDDTNTLLLVILAIILPPLAVYLYEDGWTSRVTLNLILTLLCGLPGMIHALIVILGKK